MANEKFKVKFGLEVGDTAATIDATTGEVIAALNNDGQVKIGKGSATDGSIDIGNRSRAIAGSPFIDFNSSVNAIDFDVRLIASGGSGTDGQGTLTAYAASIVTTGTLDVQGGTITDSTGALSITTGASNGNLTLAPNGTGSVALTLANGGNLTNDRNYVFGAIRNSTTQSNGDIWVLDADSGGAGTLPVRGISLDNSTDFATKNAGVVVRNYSNTAVFSPRVVFERSRYTGTPATPLTLSSGDTIGVIAGTGYSSTLGWINDTLPFAPAVMSLATAEAWASNTNLGTTFNVLLAPTATTMTTAANLITVIAANPQTFACRSDAYTWSNGKTGSTQRMSLDVSGNLIVSNKITTSGGTFDNITAIDAQSNLLNTNNAAGTSVGIKTNYWTSSAKTTRSVPQANYSLGNFRFNSNSDTSDTFVLGGSVQCAATENFTATANGTKIQFTANKIGLAWNDATFNSVVISASPDATIFSSDAFTFNTSAASPTKITGNKIDYNRVYGQFEYNTTVTPAAADTAAVFPLGTASINNIVTVGSTSRLIAGAAGIYNLQFSLQVENADNANDHDAYIWLRKNGSDVTGSMGRVTVPKNNAGSLKIIAWNYLVSSANVTDYWEIAYAVSDTDVTFPAFASTAFGPSTATIITSLVSVGA